jgi:membrane fusion protein, multidrug efflux system
MDNNKPGKMESEVKKTVAKVEEELKKYFSKARAAFETKKQLRVAVYIIAALIAVWAIKGIFFTHRGPNIPPKPVQTAVTITKDTPIYIESFGTLTPPDDVNIKAQVEGEIKEIHFTDGQDVKKGDLLFVIDPAPYQANLKKASAQTIQDAADLKFKTATLERNQQLLKDKLISQQQNDQYQTDVASSEAKLKLDEAGVDLAKINLGYCYITSPIDGRAGKCMVDPGNIVSANTGPTLVNIKTIDEMYLDFTIPERNLPGARNSMAAGKLDAEFTVQGDEKNIYKGQITFIDNTVDNTTGTVMLRATVPNKERKLWAGQFANIKLILGTEKNAVLAPYEAVQLGQKGPYVFVVTSNNIAELKSVVTGYRQGDFIVINKGLSSGEKVVTAGQLGLSPGAPVIDIGEEKKK